MTIAPSSGSNLPAGSNNLTTTANFNFAKPGRYDVPLTVSANLTLRTDDIYTSAPTSTLPLTVIFARPLGNVVQSRITQASQVDALQTDWSSFTQSNVDPLNPGRVRVLLVPAAGNQRSPIAALYDAGGNRLLPGTPTAGRAVSFSSTAIPGGLASGTYLVGVSGTSGASGSTSFSLSNLSAGNLGYTLSAGTGRSVPWLAGSGSFSDPARWAGGVPPEVLDDAVFAAPGTQEVQLTRNEGVWGIQADAGSATITPGIYTLDLYDRLTVSGGTLRVNGTLVTRSANTVVTPGQVGAGQGVNLSSGRLIATNFTGTGLNWTGGTLELAGGTFTSNNQLIVPNTGTLAGQGSINTSVSLIGTGTFAATGTLTGGPFFFGPSARAVIASGIVAFGNNSPSGSYFDGDSTVEILPGATFRVTDTTGVYVYDGATFSLRGGTLDATPSTGYSLISHIDSPTIIEGFGTLSAPTFLYDELARVEARSGTLHVTGPLGAVYTDDHDTSNVISAAPNATLRLSGGNVANQDGLATEGDTISASGTVIVDTNPFAARLMSVPTGGTFIAEGTNAAAGLVRAGLLSTRSLAVTGGSTDVRGTLATYSDSNVTLSAGTLRADRFILAAPDANTTFAWTGGTVQLDGGTLNGTLPPIPAGGVLSGNGTITASVSGPTVSGSAPGTIAALGTLTIPTTLNTAAGGLTLTSGTVALINTNAATGSGMLQVRQGATLNLAPASTFSGLALSLAGGTVSGTGTVSTNLSGFGELKDVKINGGDVSSIGGILLVTARIDSLNVLASSPGSTMVIRRQNEPGTLSTLLPLGRTIIERPFNAGTTFIPGGTLELRSALLRTVDLHTQGSTTAVIESSGSFGAIILEGFGSTFSGTLRSTGSASLVISSEAPLFGSFATQTFTGSPSTGVSFSTAAGAFAIRHPVLPSPSLLVQANLATAPGTLIEVTPAAFAPTNPRLVARAGLDVGGTIRFGPSITSGGTVPARGVIYAEGLSIASDGAPLGSRTYSGFVDLGDHAMIIKSGDLAEIRDAVRSWCNLGLRDGTGLGTTAIATPYTTVAVFSNALPSGSPYFPTFAGIALSAADLIAQFTYTGDTDLDGDLDGHDLANFIEGFSTGATGWQNGDFNYDGVVNAADYGLLAAGLAANLPALGSPADAGGGSSGVIPEPSALALLMLSAMSLSRRRR